ncbi:MAG: glycosyltransferase [Hydrogenothermaceae bacterium]
MSGFCFRKSDVDFELFKFRDYEFKANSDTILWMNLVKKGKAFLYKDFTNVFRIHGANEQFSLLKKGAEEKLIIYSKDSLNYLGVNINPVKYSEFVYINLYFIKELGFTEKVKELWLSEKEEKMYREGFSVIIVTYKSEETIEGCINSFADTLTEKDEIIIIDNSPDSRTEEAVRELLNKYKNIRFIKNKENIGYAKAINQGVKLAKNGYLVFLNPDTKVISKNWLEYFYLYLKDEEVGAVGGISNAAFFYNNIISYTNVEILSKLSDKEIANSLFNIYKDYFKEVRLLSGFCVATKKEIFADKYGYFDESLILGFDDFDYSMFLVNNGYKQLVIPSIYIKHLNHKSFEKDDKKANKLNQISFNNFMKKLIKKYGYGNVPEPYEFFSDSINLMPYPFFQYLVSGKYRFIFNFSHINKDKEFFREKAKLIKSKPLIAIITVNYKSHQDVCELAYSVINNSYPNIAFIVVDNSEDEEEFLNLEKCITEAFRGSQKKFYILKNKNTGYAGGNNLGIKFAIENLNPEYIWLLNPDTVITENTPIELVRTVEFTDVPVATCKIVDYYTKLCQYNGLKVDFNGIKEEKSGIFRVSFLSGANIFMKKEVIDKIGYMDEKFFLYFEDNEYFSRMLKSNIYPLYTPFTYIYHKGSKTTGKFLTNPLTVYYFVRNLLHWNKEISTDLSSAKNHILYLYQQNIYKRDMLFAILKGVIDYYRGIYGKADLNFSITPEKISKPEPSNNIEEYISNLEKYLFSKPKDIESFKNLLELIRLSAGGGFINGT